MFRWDRNIRRLFVVLSFTAIAIVALIYVFIASETLVFANKFGLGALFSGGDWYPTEGSFDISAIVIGTLLTTALALLFAAPIGLSSAVLGFEFRSYRRSAYRRCLEVLGGIPSVVIGLWGLTTVVPLILKIEAPGTSLLAGGIVLGMMVVPTVGLVTLSAFEGVPKVHIDTGHALGLTRWSILWRIVVPQSRNGIIAALILGLGRAVGETMAVLMVCGNVVQVPSTWFEPVRTLTANIALEMAYAMDDHRAALFSSGAILLVFVTIFVVISERFSDKHR